MLLFQHRNKNPQGFNFNVKDLHPLIGARRCTRRPSPSWNKQPIADFCFNVELSNRSLCSFSGCFHFNSTLKSTSARGDVRGGHPLLQPGFADRAQRGEVEAPKRPDKLPRWRQGIRSFLIPRPFKPRSLESKFSIPLSPTRWSRGPERELRFAIFIFVHYWITMTSIEQISKV